MLNINQFKSNLFEIINHKTNNNTNKIDFNTVISNLIILSDNLSNQNINNNNNNSNIDFNSNNNNKSKQNSIDIKTFLKSVRDSNELFNNDYHHDAPEFLLWLIEHIHEDLIKNKVFFNINDITVNNQKDTFISNLFHGEQYSITKCLNCEYNFKRKESYNNLAVDIEQNVSLTYCLKKYIKKEVMKNKDKYHCDNCNSLQEAEK